MYKRQVLGGADTWATSQTIAGAIRNLEYDLIITGRQAIDGDTAQVGPQISEHLGIPVISYAQKIKVEGDSVIVERQFDDRYHVLKAKMPCLITALGELNEPRYMTPGGIFDAYKKEITVWGRANLVDVDDSNLGLKGSPTQIAKASDKVRKGAGQKVVLDLSLIHISAGRVCGMEPAEGCCSSGSRKIRCRNRSCGSEEEKRNHHCQ